MAGPPEGFEPCEEWNNGPIDDGKWKNGSVDEDVTGTVIEFARWINYLLHPEKHDGPRRYVCAECGYELEINWKMTEIDLRAVTHNDPRSNVNHTSREWELHSVIEGFDPSRAFYAIHEASGIQWRGSMEECFGELKDTYLCREQKAKPEKSHLYKPEESFRNFTESLDSLLKGIGGEDPRHEPARAYHEAVERYAKCHENQMFTLAEVLGRYRGIYRGTRDLLLKRMQKTVEIFEQKVSPQPADISWGDVLEVAVSLALSAAFSVVPVVDGFVARVAYGVITGAISELITGLIPNDEAGRQYTPTSPKDAPTAWARWIDLVNWFVSEADRISNELYISIAPGDNMGCLTYLMTTQLLEIRNETDAERPPEVPGLFPRSEWGRRTG